MENVDKKENERNKGEEKMEAKMTKRKMKLEIVLFYSRWNPRHADVFLILFVKFLASNCLVY